MHLLTTLRSKYELYRLEQRYTRRREKRTTFASGATYVDGEYVYPTSNTSPSTSASPSPSSTAGAADSNPVSMTSPGFRSTYGVQTYASTSRELSSPSLSPNLSPRPSTQSTLSERSSPAAGYDRTGAEDAYRYAPSERFYAFAPGSPASERQNASGQGLDLSASASNGSSWDGDWRARS